MDMLIVEQYSSGCENPSKSRAQHKSTRSPTFLIDQTLIKDQNHSPPGILGLRLTVDPKNINRLFIMIICSNLFRFFFTLEIC